ncbi:MAG: SDR family NAD(P)-dependent oxidoreductase, partial [Desulfobacterales bacterium]|nr:SDR family NAD(P)-dependent oxidoreductase [Desulfobacterales bacterium]
KRLVVEAVKATAPVERVNIFDGKLFLVTADDHGFANGVIQKIQKNHGRAIPVFQEGSSRGSAHETADFNDPGAAADAAARLSGQHGPISGLIHLVPLNGYFNGKAVDDRAANMAVKSLFGMVKALSGGLDSLVSAISFDSVVFPYLPDAGAIHAPFAGMAGLMKTVNKELPDALVKAVDFSHPDPRAAIDEIVDLYMAELMSGDKRVETGHRGKEKFVLSLKESPAEKGPSFIKKDAAVVVTGGARGVTFEILKSLAAEFAPCLVIMGRSDVGRLTPRLEAADGADMMAILKEDMPGARPIEIKKAADRMMNLKKTAANLETLRRMGVRVDYHAVDVTDAEAVKSVLQGCGPIDGVIHAAGVEESQFIEKKTLDSFSRVFDVKIRGAFNLLSALADREYDFFCAFSSVTARFGNEGQVDYTAANDMLGKMLQGEKQKHPGRAYKVFAWTAWEGAGMATNETVKKVLRSRGLEFLPLARGVRYFMDELRDARREEAVFSGIDHAFDPDGLLTRGAPAGTPFLDSVVDKAPGKVRHARILDLKRDLFLMDHCREEIPIFLGATGIETMAEAASTLAGPGARPVELTNFSIPYGIKILKGRPKEIHAIAERVGEKLYQCDIVSQFRNKKGVIMGKPTHHYTGRFRFAHEAPEKVRVALPEYFPVECDGDLQDLLYHPARLFMDGLFRTVEEILSFDGETLVTRIRNSSEKPFFADNPAPDFLTDVAVVDAMFQTGGMLEVMAGSDIVLPKAIARARFLGPIRKNVDYICLTRKSAAGKEINAYDLQLVDQDGVLLLEINGFEMVKVDKLGPENRIDDKLVITRWRKAA